MVPTYFRYPLIALIILSIVLYILTFQWDSAKVYLESLGIAWVASWIFFFTTSYLLIKWRRTT